MAIGTINPQTIYDDVAALTERVVALESAMTTVLSQLSGIGVVQLTNGTDLNTLGVGRYTIPNTTISASLVNKPANANAATGHIDVIESGNSGQLMMYYYPCSKEGASYWERAYYESSWGPWNEVNTFDSGWIDLPLAGSVIAFNDEQKPRYRRIGKEVFISGVVKNISAFNTVIATMPANYRPSKKVIFAIPSTATKFSRISIQTNGVMTYEQSNDDIVGITNWHSIACSYNVD